MVSDRLRIRDESELELQNKGLIELSNILKSIEIPHFLSSGTLLGAVRQGNFIPWDWDVQFYFKLEDVKGQYEKILHLFESSGFVSKKLDTSDNHWKIVVIKYNTEYEMTAWEKSGKMRVRSNWSISGHFFESPDTIDFLGNTYQCMTPATEYLEYCYGKDWRTPKRIDDKSEYLADTFYQQSKYIRRFKQILKTIRNLFLGLLPAPVKTNIKSIKLSIYRLLKIKSDKYNNNL